MLIEIFHNPKCSKSRQALNLLEECLETQRENKNFHLYGVGISIILYQKEPLDAQVFLALKTALGVPSLRDMMRVQEKRYKELGLDTHNEEGLVEALCANPALLERPIVCYQGRAVIGRPPENVLALLENVLIKG